MCAVALAAVTPFAAFASSFGLSPSVYETTAPRGQTLQASVSLSRANPNKDAYLRVSTRHDPGGAIVLTNGERLLMPLGTQSITYRFEIDTDKIDESGLLDAGIEFSNEEANAATDSNSVVYGVVMQVKVEIGDPPSAVEEVSEDDQAKESVAEKGAWDARADELFLAVGALALLVSALLWLLGRREPWASTAFLISTLAFLAAMLGWAFASGRVEIGQFKDVADGLSLRGGSFFLVADAGEDVFLNVAAGTQQAMEGDWRYVGSSADRVWTLPATDEQQEVYENRVFRFEEASIRPFGSVELPGLVDDVTENVQGTYAVFSGARGDGERFWCLAEVFESPDVVCDFLEERVRESIAAVSFSSLSQNVIVIHTNDASYEYDAWRKQVKPLEETRELPPGNEEFPRPLEGEAMVSRWGFVRLDEQRFFVGTKKTYVPLESGVWIERRRTGVGERLFIVKTGTGERASLTNVRSGQTLYWLQKEGFITSP